MMETADTLVLALGNPLRGDDGIGTVILNEVKSQAGNCNVDYLDGGIAGLETVLLLQGYRRAIIIDAADMGLEAGMWRRFTLDEVSLGNGDLRGSLHTAGLAEALALAEALDVLPEQIVIYGVQPASIGWETGLGEPVRRAVPAVCAAILSELTS